MLHTYFDLHPLVLHATAEKIFSKSRSVPDTSLLQTVNVSALFLDDSRTPRPGPGPGLQVSTALSLTSHCSASLLPLHPRRLHSPSTAAVTKSYRPGGGNKLISHISRGWKFKIKGSAGLFLLRPLSLACRQPPSCCVFT